MTPAEAATLLTVAAAFDNRKPDADAAMAWSRALGDLPFIDCRDAIVAHYQKTTEWLMPSHVITTVKQIRVKRIAEAGDLTPPTGLSDEQGRAWIGEARRRIGDGLEVTADHGELKERHLPDLRALMPRPSVHPELTTTTTRPDRETLEGADA